MTQAYTRRDAQPRPEGSGVTLGQLRVFGAVAEGEHLTRAAKALRMSQGSVSAQVRRLEGTLGMPLLHRVGRNVRLTDFGRSLRPLAREVLAKAQEIDDLATRFQQKDEGVVAVAAGTVIGAHRVGRWLSPFVRSHPRIEVNIAVIGMQKAIDALARGEIDVAIVGDAVAMPGIETIDLEHTELVIVAGCNHPLATSSRPLRALNQYRYLVHGQGSATQIQAERALARHVDGAQRVELQEEALLGALHAGIGYAVMPRAIVEADIASSRLITVPYPDPQARVVFTAARRLPPHTPAAQALWSHLVSLTSTD